MAWLQPADFGAWDAVLQANEKTQILGPIRWYTFIDRFWIIPDLCKKDNILFIKHLFVDFSINFTLLGFHSVMYSIIDQWSLKIVPYYILRRPKKLSFCSKSAKDKSVRLINWIIINVLAFFYRNIADPEDWLCLQLIGFPILNYLLVWRAACVCLLQLFCQHVNWRNENWVLQTEESHSWVT